MIYRLYFAEDVLKIVMTKEVVGHLSRGSAWNQVSDAKGIVGF